MKNGVSHWDDAQELCRYLEKILEKSAGDGSGLLYGLGHAGYTLSDPRATLLKQFLRRIVPGSGYERKLQFIEDVGRLAPEAFAKVKGGDRPLCANVDLYSGLAYTLPPQPQGRPDFITAPFAKIAARLAGVDAPVQAVRRQMAGGVGPVGVRDIVLPATGAAVQSDASPPPGDCDG